VNIFNDNFTNFSTGEKYGTIFYALGKYLLLLFFPNKLICDYTAFEIPIIGITEFIPIISLIVYIILFLLAIKLLKSKNILSFSILFYLFTISVYSNILYSTGTVFAERFSYIPSLGFCLALAFLLVITFPSFIKNEKVRLFVPYLILLSILGFWGFKTIKRNSEWRTWATVIEADIKKPNNCARLNFAYADYLFDGKKETAQKNPQNIDLAKPYYKKAISIYPQYVEAQNGLALCYYYQQCYDSAAYCFLASLKINPNQENVYKNIIIVVDKNGNKTFGLKIFHQVYPLNPGFPALNYKIGKLYKELGQKDSAIFYLQKAIALNGNYTKAIKELEEIQLNNIR
jgi:tetratricopeptide (TPR) repeat protein